MDIKSSFITAFIDAVKNNILYAFRPVINFALGFFSVVPGVSGTAYAVYTSSGELDSDIEKYSSIPGAVFIVTDAAKGKYAGKVVNGKNETVNIYLETRQNAKKETIKIFSSNASNHDEILKSLQGSRTLADISAFVAADKENPTGISFEGSIIKAGIRLIENRTPEELNAYMAELSKIQRQWRSAQADKNILDIAHLDAGTDAKTIEAVINTLSSQTIYQQSRVMLNEAQMETLTALKTIEDLQLLGVEVFLSVESADDKKTAEYTEKRVSGILVNGVLTDLNTGKPLNARTFLTKEDLNGKKLNNILSDNYQGYNIIGLNLIKEEINNSRNLILNNSILSAALGWLGKTFSLKEITEQDAANMARQTEFREALRIDGDLTETAAKDAMEKLPEAQIMLGQLTGDAKTAYEQTMTAEIIVLNMIERKKSETGKEMKIERDAAMQRTLTQLVQKGIDKIDNFNGADYLQAITLDINSDLTFGEIIAQALKDGASPEQIKEAIAAVVSDTFVSAIDFKTDRKKEEEKARQMRLGMRAILAAA
jgi:hypothetical protein